jgi:hypothetical protein
MGASGQILRKIEGVMLRPPPSPRSALLAALFDGARVAVLEGDLDAVRVAHEAIGKLILPV